MMYHPPRASRTRRPRLRLEALEARSLLTTLVALLDSGVDLNWAPGIPYYDMTYAYNANTRQTASSFGGQVVLDDDTPNHHGHGATVAEHIVRGIQDAAAAYGSSAAPAVKIMPIKITGPYNEDQRLVEAVYYAVDHGAAVVNYSRYAMWGDVVVNDASSPYNGKRLSDAVRYADSKGVVVTAAPGNSNRDVDGTNPNNTQSPTPAKFDQIDYSGGASPLPTNLLVAAAVDPQSFNLYNTAGTSNWGAKTVDLGAPVADGASSYSSGYTAGVAGAVSAALRARFTTGGLVSARDVIDTILATVTPKPQPVASNWSVTNGVINAQAAVDRTRLGKSFADVQTISVGSTTYAFALAQDATIYYAKQTAAGDPFSAWTAVPNSTGSHNFAVTVVNTTPYLLMRSLNNKVYANALIGAATNSWTGWNEVANSLGAERVYPYVDPTGTYLYITGQNGGSVYYNRLDTFAGTSWNLVPGSQGVVDLRVVPYTTTSASYHHVVALQPYGGGKAVFNSIRTSPSGNVWTPWTMVAGSSGTATMDVAPTPNNSTFIVIAKLSGAAYLNSVSYASPGGVGWSLVPGGASDVRSVSAFLRADGRVGVGMVTQKGYSYENYVGTNGWGIADSSTLALYLAGIQDVSEYRFNGASDGRIYRTWGGQLIQIASNKTRLLPQLS